ncbi:hypothetical protein [Legionella fairfieldensis]|uniref:hypothetical protein n=1 Tax=Legionella fairfieldensis TaxID=45064 RepID=UPI00048B35A1|nr:hypothetical protein [Legionella fairfieldensis]
MDENIIYTSYSREGLYEKCLSTLKYAYNDGGKETLRQKNKSKGKTFNDNLKKIKEELFPLALYLKNMDGISNILIPDNISNPEFDAKVQMTNGNEFFVDVTLAVDWKPKSLKPKQASIKNKNELNQQDENTLTINKIKEAILKKLDCENDKKYTPILLVEFNNNNGAGFLYSQEYNFLKKEISEFLLKNEIKEKLKKFSKIVLINFIHTPDFVEKVYNDPNTIFPNEAEEKIFIWCAYPEN